MASSHHRTERRGKNWGCGLSQAARMGQSERGQSGGRAVRSGQGLFKRFGRSKIQEGSAWKDALKIRGGLAAPRAPHAFTHQVTSRLGRLSSAATWAAGVDGFSASSGERKGQRVYQWHLARWDHAAHAGKGQQAVLQPANSPHPPSPPLPRTWRTLSARVWRSTPGGMPRPLARSWLCTLA